MQCVYWVSYPGVEIKVLSMKHNKIFDFRINLFLSTSFFIKINVKLNMCVCVSVCVGVYKTINFNTVNAFLFDWMYIYMDAYGMREWKNWKCDVNLTVSLAARRELLSLYIYARYVCVCVWSVSGRIAQYLTINRGICGLWVVCMEWVFFILHSFSHLSVMYRVKVGKCNT